MQYYNVHSHLFTMNNAPKRFLHLYLPDLAADLVDKITNTQAGSKIFQSLLRLGGPGAKKYASFLRIGKSVSQLEVFEDLMQQYDDVNIKFIALSLYMEKCGAGESASGFEGQLEELINLKRQYPDRLLVFMGIDPRWKSNGTELRKAVEAYFEKKVEVNANRSVYPFVGLKLYPSTGFYVFDERLRETFEWAADNDVPVISHCYYHGGIYYNDEEYLRAHLNPINPYNGKAYNQPYYRKQNNIFKWILGRNAASNNRNTCCYFYDPASYEEVFKYFESRPRPLKLCLAHYAGAEQMLISNGARTPDKDEKALYGIKNLNWFEQIKQMLNIYEKSAFADIAYTLFNPDVHDVIFDELNDTTRGGKIMFGTDFYLTEQEQPEQKTYQIFKNKAVNKNLTNYGNRNAWDQIAGTNIDTFLKSKYYP